MFNASSIEMLFNKKSRFAVDVVNKNLSPSTPLDSSKHTILVTLPLSLYFTVTLKGVFLNQ